MLNLICREPYRVLFPAGLVMAFFGLGVWVTWWLWPGESYPLSAHADIQIKGLMMCFVYGFLLTMMPRLLEIKPIGPLQFLLIPVGMTGILMTGMHGSLVLANLIHLLLLGNFLLFVVIRFPGRRHNPPPPFVWVGLAMLAMVLATILLLAGQWGWLDLPTRVFFLVKGIQLQGFLLMLILGISSLLMPRLLGGGAGVQPADLHKGSRTAGQYLGQLLLALIFLSSWAVENLVGDYSTGLRLAMVMRLGVCLWIFCGRSGIARWPAGQPFFIKTAWLALWSIPVSFLFNLVDPSLRMAWDHILYVNGFLLLAMSIASRVIATHGGREELLTRSRKWVLVYSGILLLGMVTRVTAPLLRTRDIHLGMAAASVLLALLIWAALFFTALTGTPDDGS